jgi:hypothetical protein
VTVLNIALSSSYISPQNDSSTLPNVSGGGAGATDEMPEQGSGWVPVEEDVLDEQV